MLQSYIVRENSRRSSYAFSIHPPTRKFEAKLLLASGLENFCQGHTEKIRGEAPIKETLPYIPKYTYVWYV